MNMETLLQNMEVQEEFVERFEKLATNLSKKRKKVQEEEEQKEQKLNELLITQTQLSLKEFEERLRNRLPNDRIQMQKVI